MDFLEICGYLPDSAMVSLDKSGDTILIKFKSFDAENLDLEASYLFSAITDFSISDETAFDFFGKLGNSEILDADLSSGLGIKTLLTLNLELFDYESKKRDYLGISFAYETVVFVKE
jgi:hypothetical protein